MNYSEAWRQAHNLCTMFEGLTKFREVLEFAKDIENDITKLEKNRDTMVQEVEDVIVETGKKKSELVKAALKVQEEHERARAAYESDLAAWTEKFHEMQNTLEQTKIAGQIAIQDVEKELAMKKKDRDDKLHILEAQIVAKTKRLDELTDQLASIGMAVTKVIGGGK